MSNQNEINQKMIINSISAYLMIFISWLLLFNKKEEVNNPFTKSHIRNSIIIHSAFFLIYLIFGIFGVSDLNIFFGISFDRIILTSSFIILFGILLYFIYGAFKGKINKITEKVIGNKSDGKINLLDINGDSKIDEKDKLTIIASYVPLIGFLIYPQYRNNKIISSAYKLNLIVTYMILFLMVANLFSITSLLVLVYLVGIVFIGINLFTRDSIISINLGKVQKPSEIILKIKSLIEYFILYLKLDFKKYFEINAKNIKDEQGQNILNKKDLSEKKDIKINKYFIYLPVINLIFLFFKDNKYNFHIRSGIMITLVTILFLLINPDYILLVLPIIFISTGYLKANILEYRIPVLAEIYNGITKIIKLVTNGFRDINKKRKYNEGEKLVVGEKTKNEE